MEHDLEFFHINIHASYNFTKKNIPFSVLLFPYLSTSMSNKNPVSKTASCLKLKKWV